MYQINLSNHLVDCKLTAVICDSRNNKKSAKIIVHFSGIVDPIVQDVALVPNDFAAIPISKTPKTGNYHYCIAELVIDDEIVDTSNTVLVKLCGI
jgi:hypothetical protein